MKKLLIILSVLCMVLMPMLASAESGRTVTVSGTATVMVEADTEEICEKYVDGVIDVIREKGHIEQ